MAKPFSEIMFDKLYEVFRTMGIGLSVPQLEQLRTSSAALAEAISQESTTRAIEMLGRIQKTLVDNVSELDKKVQALTRANISNDLTDK